MQIVLGRSWSGLRGRVGASLLAMLVAGLGGCTTLQSSMPRSTLSAPKLPTLCATPPSDITDATLCNSITDANTLAVAYGNTASSLSNSEAGAGGAFIGATVLGAAFTALNPGNTDNIALASILGASATGWRTGLKPGERANVLYKGADALNCVARRGLEFFNRPVDLTTMKQVYAEGVAAWRTNMVALEALRANEQSLDADARIRGGEIEKLTLALNGLKAANDALAVAIGARMDAPGHIYSAITAIQTSSRAAYLGQAPNYQAIVDLLAAKPSPATPGAPAPAGGGTVSFQGFRGGVPSAADLDGSSTSEDIAAVTGYLTALTYGVAASGGSADAATFEAISTCIRGL